MKTLSLKAQILATLLLSSISVSGFAAPLEDLIDTVIAEKSPMQACRVDISSQSQSVPDKKRERWGSDKTSIKVSGRHVLSQDKLLAPEEGIILKSGQAYLRPATGGRLRLFHGYIPVWTSPESHIEWSQTGNTLRFRLTGLEQLLDNAPNKLRITRLTLTATGQLIAWSNKGRAVWSSKTYMAQGDDVLQQYLYGDQAPNSIVKPTKRNLDWDTQLGSTIMLRNGNTRLEWANRLMTLYQSNKKVWSPSATGGATWQTNGALAVYDGDPSFHWGSGNWMTGVPVGKMLGISEDGQLMISDEYGCLTWVVPSQKPNQIKSAIPSRDKLCRKITATQNSYRNWVRTKARIESYKCPL